jgi:hypothetical protein
MFRERMLNPINFDYRVSSIQSRGFATSIDYLASSYKLQAARSYKLFFATSIEYRVSSSKFNFPDVNIISLTTESQRFHRGTLRNFVMDIDWSMFRERVLNPINFESRCFATRIEYPNHQPPTTNHQPPTTNHQPPTTNN